MSDDFRRVTEWVALHGRGLPVIEVSISLARELQRMWPHLALEGSPWHVLTAEGPVVLRLPHRPTCRCTGCEAVRTTGEVWVWDELHVMARAQPPASKSSAPPRRASDASQVRPLPEKKPEKKSERETLPPVAPVSLSPGGRRFVVTIFYEEPTYATRRGIDRKTYRGSFTVHARSAAEATAKAKVLFEQAARMASVSWVREIVRTECRAA